MQHVHYCISNKSALHRLFVTHVKREPPDSKVNSDVVCVCVYVCGCCILSCCAVALVTGMWLSMGWPVEPRKGEGSKKDGQENVEEGELLAMKGGGRRL